MSGGWRVNKDVAKAPTLLRAGSRGRNNTQCSYEQKVANVCPLGVSEFFPRSRSFLSGPDSRSDEGSFPAGKTVFCRGEDFVSA